MFCENCGNKTQEGYKFCTKCGYSTLPVLPKDTVTNYITKSNEKWWHRLLRVIYIIAYIPLPILLMLVWSENSSSYSSAFETTGDAFWYSLLTLVIYVVIIRLIKIAVLYVAVGRKPEWRQEFKKLF